MICICQAGHCDDACSVCAGLDNECPYRENDNLIVTVNIEDVATAFADGGIIRLTGTDEDGRRVTFAGDHRPMSELIEGLLSDEDESATVELEAWQVLSITEGES